MYGQMVDPTSDAVKTCHNRSNYLAIEARDEKQLRLNSEFSTDHRRWFVPGWIIRENVAPKGNDLRVVPGFVRSNL